MNKFLGLQYPLMKTPRGLMAQKTGVDQIKADLIQLLLTNPGERVMMPTFGTALRKLQFQPNDSALEIEAKNMIAQSIKEWEPRIEIQNIAVTSNVDVSYLDPNDPGYDRESILYIKIDFIDPENISKIEQLQLEYSVGG